MVHSASIYETVDKQRSLTNQAVVFTIRKADKFLYEFNLINATGYSFLKKQISSSLVYEVNINGGYLKWLHLPAGTHKSKIIEVNFGEKKDVAMSVKFAIQ